jgi:hypothetical protein
LPAVREVKSDRGRTEASIRGCYFPVRRRHTLPRAGRTR